MLVKMNSAKEIIEKLDLQSHPEGGYFKEVYRSPDEIKEEGLPERYKSKRAVATSIYYLLEGKQFSAFHKLNSDETWHFYLGSPVILHLISEDGEYSEITLGSNLSIGEVFQFTIPHGTWFAAEVKDKSSFSLAGCIVSPGFDFEDFEMGKRNNLIEQFPEQSEVINRLTLS